MTDSPSNNLGDGVSSEIDVSRLRTPPANTAGVVAVQPAEHSAQSSRADGSDTPTVRADDLGSMLWGFRTELNNSAFLLMEGLTRLLRRILL